MRSYVEATQAHKSKQMHLAWLAMLMAATLVACGTDTSPQGLAEELHATREQSRAILCGSSTCELLEPLRSNAARQGFTCTQPPSGAVACLRSWFERRTQEQREEIRCITSAAANLIDCAGTHSINAAPPKLSAARRNTAQNSTPAPSNTSP